MFCIACGKQIPVDANFCPYCGTRVAEAVRHALVLLAAQSDANFCPHCGTRVTGGVQQAAAPHAAQPVAPPVVSPSPPTPAPQPPPPASPAPAAPPATATAPQTPPPASPAPVVPPVTAAAPQMPSLVVPEPVTPPATPLVAAEPAPASLAPSAPSAAPIAPAEPRVPAASSSAPATAPSASSASASADPGPLPPTTAASPAAAGAVAQPAPTSLPDHLAQTVVASQQWLSSVADQATQAFSAPAAAPSPSVGQWVVISGTGGAGAYLRRTPQREDRLTAFPEETRLAIVGDDTEGDGLRWRYVQAPDGQIGWIPADYVRPADPAPPTSEAAAIMIVTPQGSGLYLRRTPQMADRLTAWPDGTRFEVVGPDVDGEGQRWKYVRSPNGELGYIPAAYAQPTA